MIKTRFAPSPTGALHLGGARTALFSWLAAKQFKGKFLLRIEDTDQKRHVQSAVDGILEGLKWLGITWDEGPVFQSERANRYELALNQLEALGYVYRCSCSKARLQALREHQIAKGLKPKYDGKCRYQPEGIMNSHSEHVVRFKTPLEGTVTFQDWIRGEVITANTELDDLVLCRADKTFTYNFCVVVDDLEDQVTHIVRGEEHLNNTPRQIHLLNAFNAAIPTYAHVGVILDETGQKLSKRHGASDVLSFKEAGFLPEAMINYLARLGWGYGDAEIFTREQLIDWFQLKQVRAAPSTFELQKLTWVNQQHLKVAKPNTLLPLVLEQLKSLLTPLPSEESVLPLITLFQTRSETVKQLAAAILPFFRVPDYTEALREQHSDTSTKALLKQLLETLDHLKEWKAEQIQQTLKQLTQELDVNFAQLARPLRAVLLGTEGSPSIGLVCEAFPKETVLKRLENWLS